MAQAAELTNRHYAVVVDAARARVLVLRRNGGWSLPTWETTGRCRWNDAGPVNDAVRDLLGLDAVTLRPLLARREGGVGTWAHELGPRDPAWEPPAGARWADRAELADPVERDLVRSAFDDSRQAPPWTHASWYDEAEAWIDERLEELGRPRTGPTAQLHAWAISSVLRAPTAAGDVYFKAVPPLFGHEPALTVELGRRHPGRVTAALAADPGRRWLLMEDVGGTELSSVAEPAVWEEALRRYAELQLAWVEHTDELRALGCPDRMLDALADEIEPTLADPLLAGLPQGLAAEESSALPELGARLGEAIDRLRALGVPATLEHGDLHPGNVRSRPEGPVFYDWTDGCVSVPSFSLVPFLERDPFGGTRLRDAYLEPWGDLLPLEAFDLSQYLGRFHLAVSYRAIAHATEPRQRWELGSTFPELIRGLLA